MDKLPMSGVMHAGRYQELKEWSGRIVAGSGMWPTPTSKDGPSGPGASEKREGGLNLRTAVQLWPTPTARDWKSGNSNLMTKNARPLSEVVTGGKGGTLNPQWVEWLMGFGEEYTNV